MAITATSSGSQRELVPAGNYIATCYKMVQIGTVTEIVMGKAKVLHKVRIGWELPEETRVFNEEKGAQPIVIENEYTLSLHEKSALRGILKSWRGKDFTEEEAKAFDITKLIGVPCMLNIIHKQGKADPTKTYEQIAGITPLPKSVKKPVQINPSFVLSYDDWDETKYNALPDFIKTKMASSMEYMQMRNPNHQQVSQTEDVHIEDDSSDLPF